MNLFPYVAKVPTYQLPNLRDGGTVTVAIDMIDQSGAKEYGILEIVTATTAAWLGGVPVWTMLTSNAPIGDNSTVVNANITTHVGEVKWQANGSALMIINQEGSKLFTDFPDELQAILDSDPRFHTGTGQPPPSGPPFTDESVALAWLQGLVPTFKIVAGKIVLI